MKVDWDRRAERQLGKLDRPVAVRISDAIEEFASAGKGDVTAMKGMPNVYRLRVGDWRVVFIHENGRLVITKIGHRSEVYSR